MRLTLLLNVRFEMHCCHSGPCGTTGGSASLAWIVTGGRCRRRFSCVMLFACGTRL